MSWVRIHKCEFVNDHTIRRIKWTGEEYEIELNNGDIYKSPRVEYYPHILDAFQICEGLEEE